MSSTGQILGTVAGAVIGAFIPGGYVMLGASLGGMLGAAIDPPKGPNLAGPRISDLSQQGSSYGAQIPRIYGVMAVMGNIFWIENNALKETSKTESQGGKGGGGGPETTTYTYSATFALGLCEGPIAGVRRIWISGKLIYDASSSDPETIIASNTTAVGWRVHLGTATQEADSRMQASLGIANTPAYRGLAYIVFDDLQLAEYGNTLLGAQIKVEVISQGSFTPTITNIFDINLPTNSPFVGLEYDKNIFSYAHIGLFDGSYSWDSGTVSGQVTSTGVPMVELKYLNDPTAVSPTIRTNIVKNRAGFFTGYGTAWGEPSSKAKLYYLGTPLYNFTFRGTLDIQWRSVGLVMDDAGCLYGVPFIAGDNKVYLYKMETGSVIASNAGFSTASDGTEVTIALSPDGSHLVMHGAVTSVTYGNCQLVVFETAGMTVVANVNTAYTDLIGYSAAGVIVKVGDTVHILNPLTLTQIKEYSGISISKVQSNAGSEAFSDNLFSYGGSICLFHETLTASSTTLADIVSAEVSKTSILTASDIVVSSLSDIVAGYRITATTALRAPLEQLQGAYPFDVVQRGYKIHFIRRGGTSSISTISASELGAHEFGGKADPSIIENREMDSQLPSRVFISHFDTAREYDIGEQYAERLAVQSDNVQRIEMPVAMTSAEAAQKAEVLLYMYWLERYQLSFSLPPSYAFLEPSDIITVEAKNATYNLRLISVDSRSDNVIECVARFNDAAIYTSTQEGVPGQVIEGNVMLALPSQYVLLDIPSMLDSFDTPGFAVAMCGYTSTWPGGHIARSSDAWQTSSIINSFALQSTIGYASNAIPAPIDSRVVDSGSALAVTLHGGATLSSISESQMFAGGNHFAYGDDGRWEIIAARTCSLQPDGSYLLTDMLRGRFGTEHAVGLHVVGDRIILLNSALQFSNSNLNAIGTEALYRGITSGQTLDSGGDLTFTYRGVNLECLSPVYLNGNRHPSTSDWTLTWVRRTRIGGEWRDLVDVPLGEASEAYEVEIYSNNTYSTIKRTLTGLATATCSYTSAQQVTDFGANQATLYIKVYQLSANVGRGYPLTSTITR